MRYAVVPVSLPRLSSEVAAARGARRWSQRELAHRSGVSVATIGALERGSDRVFTTATLGKLDDVFEWPSGHARTLIIDHVSHDALATLRSAGTPSDTTIVIDGEVTSVATSPRGDQVSRIVTVVTSDGMWVLSRVSTGFEVAAADTTDDDPMPLLTQGDRVHYAFHFVPKMLPS